LNETIIIRTATVGDLETLLQFEQGVVSVERSFDPTLKPDPNYYYDIRQMIDDPAIELVVAECEGQLIGCGYSRIERSKDYLRHEKHAYLGFMYVDPAWRGRNVNQKIIEKLKQWSISKGLSEMRLEVYYDNVVAVKAYEKAGFNKLLIEMRMGIGE